MSDAAIFTLDQLEAMAATDGFKPYAGNPVLSVGEKGTWKAGALGSMTVIRVAGVFHMYYEAWGVRTDVSWSRDEYHSLQIGHATSLDGIHWTDDPGNPVLARGANEDDWDFNGTWDPFVLCENGVFKMWYGGGTRTCDWGYAESADGSHFIKRQRISHLGAVEDDHIVYDPGTNEYHMFYWDRSKEPMALYSAASPNETDFDFAHASPIVIQGEDYPGMYKFTQVIIEDGRWYMFYSNFQHPHCPDSTVRLAVSEDGTEWHKANDNLLEGHDGEVIKVSNDLYLMYYCPRNYFDAKGCDIRVALFNGRLVDLVL